MNRISISVYIIVVLIFSSCVQATYERKVNFNVDMTGIENIQTVGVRGDFEPLNWENDLVLKDTDGDSIYTGSVVLDTPFDYFEMKLVKNGIEFELNGQNNRRVYLNKEGDTNFNATFDVEN